eukprot:GFYU01009846.1.p1 GENE.GFYU01009846.1~~GFYU01009846.1.p1  ORF type:complete len:277 (-),score=16.22 GFYU01009846.1:119-949(-)
MAANFWDSNHFKAWLFGRIDIESRNVDDRVVLKDVKDLKDSTKALTYIKAYYADYITQLTMKCIKPRQRVIATAIVYFKRFYLLNNFIHYDPALIAPCCVWIAIKAEELRIDCKAIISIVQNFELSRGSKWPYDRDTLLECELLVMEDLLFDFIVYHPYRPMAKFLEDFKLTTGPDAAAALKQKAWNVINDSYKTDVCLRYPPYLIALASIYVACVLSNQHQTLEQILREMTIDLSQVMEIIDELMLFYVENEQTSYIQMGEKYVRHIRENSKWFE